MKTMNQETLLGNIKSIEDNFPVNDYLYKKIHIWPVVRVLLLYSFKNSFTKSSAFEIPVYKTYSLKERLQQRYIAFRHKAKYKKTFQKTIDAIGQTDILLYSRSSEYGDTINGKKYNKLIDPFIEYFQQRKISVKKLEIGNSQVPKIFESSLVDISDYQIYRRAKAINEKSESADFGQLLKEVEKMCGVNVPSSAVSKALESIFVFRDLFIELLSKNKPKAVFLTVYYGHDAFGLVLACKELKIPVVDIQHGKQGKFHFMYSHWTKIPQEGYALLPDYFWNWGKESEHNISSWMPASSKHKAITGGNLWMMRWKNNKTADENNVQAFFEKLKKYKRVVLCSLQPIGDENFPDFVKETISKTKDDCFWLLRLHPKMEADDVPSLKSILEKNPNTEMTLASSLPLFRLLEESSSHVTCWSSVAFEALAFNVPTILIHPEAKSLYSENISTGVFQYCDDATAFQNAVLQNSSSADSGYIVYDLPTANVAMDCILGAG